LIHISSRSSIYAMSIVRRAIVDGCRADCLRKAHCKHSVEWRIKRFVAAEGDSSLPTVLYQSELLGRAKMSESQMKISSDE
jgi:hypothetical protein